MLCKPTGASAADRGVRPTINADCAVAGKSMWHWARLPAPQNRQEFGRTTLVFPQRLENLRQQVRNRGVAHQVRVSFAAVIVDAVRFIVLASLDQQLQRLGRRSGER